MGYAIIGIQPQRSTCSGYPSQAQAKELLQSSAFEARYEPANYIYRVGDENWIGEDCYALVVDWGDGVFAFLAADTHHGKQGIPSAVRRKLKRMAAAEPDGWDSLDPAGPA